MTEGGEPIIKGDNEVDDERAFDTFGNPGEHIGHQDASDITKIIDGGGDPFTLKVIADALSLKFKESGNVAELDSAISLMQTGFTTLPSGSDGYSLILDTLGDLFTTRFEQLNDPGDMEKAVSFYTQGLDLRGLGHAERSTSLLNLAAILKKRFDLKGGGVDLAHTISLYRESIDLHPVPHPLRPTILNNLADLLITRFDQDGLRDDFEEAVALNTQVIELMSPDNPNRPLALLNFASMLQTSYEQGGRPSDLEESIVRGKEALLCLSLPHPYHFAFLNNLAQGFTARFRQNGHESDLEEAISLQEAAIELLPSSHPSRPTSLDNLAIALKLRFDVNGQLSDLNSSVAFHREALSNIPTSSPYHSTFLNNLAEALRTRFNQSGSKSDLEESISNFTRALPSLSAKIKPVTLNNLAIALKARFDQTGRLADLNLAVLLIRQALQFVPNPHPFHVVSLNNLADVLQHRFIVTGSRKDLEEAILLHETVLQILPPSSPDKPTSLESLSRALRLLFDQTGQRKILDRAISLRRQAVELLPPSHPSQPTFFNNLADTLITRFSQTDLRGDVEEAITLQRRALELLAPTHPYRSIVMDNMAIALKQLFMLTHESRILDEAISTHRKVLQLVPSPHPARPGSLMNFGSALTVRFNNSGNLEDLDEAILVLRQGIQLLPPQSVIRGLILNSCAISVGLRYHHLNQPKDLDELMKLHEEALEALPADHRGRSTFYKNFASSLMVIHRKPGTEESNYLEQAMEYYRKAVNLQSESASQRYQFAREWASYAASNQHSSALPAYSVALQLLPQVAALSLDMKSRQEALGGGTDGLARDAAICAIRAGDLGRAVEFLEEGRAVFWSQVLNLRTPLDDLHKVSHELESKLRGLSAALELGSRRQTLAEVQNNADKLAIEREAERLNRLNEDWLNTLERIRQLQGFEDFLRPPQLSSLQVAAAKGPVVFLVGNDQESYCLIMSTEKVDIVQLQNLPNTHVRLLVNTVQTALFSSSVVLPTWKKGIEEENGAKGTRGGRPFAARSVSSDEAFIFVLEILWNEVLEPIVKILQLEKSENPPLLQWCPTGLFSFLPLHAAGRYNLDPAECASDYFISSYAPTVGTLLVPIPNLQQPLKFMAVIQEKTLPYAKKELEKIKLHAPEGCLTVLGVPGAPANIEAVVEGLSRTTVVHFACHGRQEPLKPLGSALILEDGRLPVLRIMQHRMSSGSLAFLCACETAMGDENLPDEAMSLGASLLFSGFRRVIATMWAIQDEDGPTIAEAFYEKLFQGCDVHGDLDVDSLNSARALHFAVRKLHSSNVSFRRWVPFVHMGRC